MKAKKFLSIMMLFALIISTTIVSSTALTESGPRKNKADKACSTSISKSGTTASVSATARGNNQVTKIIIKMELQKKNGSNYSTVKTWTSTTASSSASLKKTAIVSSSATYRVKSTFTVYTGSTSETIVKTAN